MDFTDFFTRKIGQFYTQFQLSFILQLIRKCVKSRFPIFFVNGYCEWFEGITGVVMQCFPVAVVVNSRPRNHRPAVVELPVERAHAKRPVSPVSFQAETHPASLHYQACIDKILEIFRRVIIPLHVFLDGVVSCGAFLVRKHSFTLQMPLVRRSKTAYGFHFRECLKSKLAHKSGNTLVKNFERLSAIPNAPVVGIAEFLTFRSAPVGGVRRRMDVGFFRVKFHHFSGQ